MDQTTALHYHLVTGEIVYKLAGSDDIHAVRANGIVADADQRFPVRLIAKAQQVVQMNWIKGYSAEESAKLTIFNCVIMNISYLGLMTSEEFQANPIGMQLKEKTPGPTLVDLGDEPMDAESETNPSESEAKPN